MIIRLSGTSDPFTTPSGLMLYVSEELAPEAQKAEASRICREAEAEMHSRIDEYEAWRWKRFIKFCHTGRYESHID